MTSFGIGFIEEFLLLLVSGIFLGVCLYASVRFLVHWSRGHAGLLNASGPVFLLAIFFFFLNIPRIRVAVDEGLAYFLVMAAITCVLLAWGTRRRDVVSRGMSGVLFLLATVTLLTFSIFQFVTADHTAFRGEELVALVDATDTQLPPNFDASTEEFTLVYKTRIPAVNLKLYYLEEGRPASPLAFMLPGEKWGVGGYVMHVRNWFFLLGDRTFYRLTSVDAKFRDNEIPHAGRNLPGYDLDETRSRLEEKIPFLNRKIGEICHVETQATEYEDMVFQPVSAGRYWGIYIQPGGGFVPRQLDPDEFHELRRRFVEPLEPIL